MTGNTFFTKSRGAVTLALLLATLLPGCLTSRAPVPTPVQRTTEAEGRKARMEREAAEAGVEAKTEAAKPATKPVATAQAAPEAKPVEKVAEKVETAVATKPEAVQPASEAKVVVEAKPAEAKVEAAKPAPSLNVEQLPTQELTLQGQYVQIASFGTEKNAQNAVAWLEANGYPASRVVRVEQGGTVLHRVQAGPFQDPAAARGALDALKAQWPQAFIPAD